MLIGSLQPGKYSDISHPTSFFILVQGLRSTLPLVATLVAVITIFIKMRNQPLRKSLFLGPLGLAAIYGMVGVVASLLSPDGLQSLYWSISYISVPIVLWAIVWGPDSFDCISRIVNFNWLIIVLGSLFLFLFALFKLNLGSILVSPSDWLNCAPQPWYTETSHFIRQTGVGRYAAIAAIIALCRIWHPQWRYVWVSIFLVSVILIFYCGSRTPILGFMGSVPVVVLLSGGKRAAVVSVALIVVLTPVVWSTGIHQEFLNNCIFRNSQSIDSQSIDSQSVDSQSIDSQSIDSQSIDSQEQFAIPTVPSPLTIPMLIPIETPPTPVDTAISEPELIPARFYTFTGRTEVWAEGLRRFRESPFIGYGFHADRLLLGAHAHNSFIHSLLQTGIIGTIPLLSALVLGWLMLINILHKLDELPVIQKISIIQITGILAFLSLRTFSESTGSFFGVDWLILGPVLLYIAILNSSCAKEVDHQ